MKNKQGRNACVCTFKEIIILIDAMSHWLPDWYYGSIFFSPNVLVTNSFFNFSGCFLLFLLGLGYGRPISSEGHNQCLKNQYANGVYGGNKNLQYYESSL